MSANKYKNFDKFREETENKVSFTMRGREYELPPSPSFKKILRIQEMVKNKELKDTFAADQVKSLTKLLIGEDNFKQLLEDDITLSEIEQLFRWLWFDVYSDNDESSGTKN